MTSKDIDHAIELVCKSLKQHSQRWRNLDDSGYANAVLWESVFLSGSMVGKPILNHPDGLRAIIQVPEDGDPPGFEGEKALRLIDKAQKGDYASRYVLCDRAADFIESERVLPAKLRDYIVELLRSGAEDRPTRRGRDPYANFARDFDIALAILEVMDRGFKPTRNRATEAESACSIVTKALAKMGVHLSEAAVEKIWNRFAADLR